jgi:hypothetical protein
MLQSMTRRRTPAPFWPWRGRTQAVFPPRLACHPVIQFLSLISKIADVRALQLELVSRSRQGFLSAAAIVPEQSLTEKVTGLTRKGGSKPSILALSSSSKFRYAAHVSKGVAFTARAALDLRDMLGVGLFTAQETCIRSQSSNVI